MTQNDQKSSTKKAFEKCLFVLKNCIKFIYTMIPFVSQSYGPKWFRRTFPTYSTRTQIEVLDIWMKFSKPTALLTKISTTKAGFGLVAYQPNLVVEAAMVERKIVCFVLANSCHILFTKENEIYMASDTPIEAYYKECLDFHTKKVINLNSFELKSSFHYTKEFEDQWYAYYNRVIVETSILLQHLTNVCSCLQNKKKKSRDMHINEIQAFQCYFKIV